MTIRQRREDGKVQEDQKSSPETDLLLPPPSPSYSSALSTFLAIFSLITPYLLRPLTALQIYLNMWPFSTPFNPATAIPSLAGKVILVTGGNIGLGQESILQLAKHKPQRIYMASRTESKALAAIKEIKSQLPKESSDVDIEFISLDLSSLKSVQAAAQAFESRSDRLDLLILNAGIMAAPPGRSESGHDIQLGTNHIGHFLLTKLLLPTLQKTAAEPHSDVRVVSVASEAFNMSPPLATLMDTEALATKGAWARYGASKAANILFAAEFARRYPAVKTVSVHPGLIKTQLYQHSDSTGGVVLNTAIRLIQPLMFVDVAHGAQNQLWAGAGSERDSVKDGAYYTPVGKLQSNKWAADVDGGKKFWDWTESELKKAGY